MLSKFVSSWKDIGDRRYFHIKNGANGIQMVFTTRLGGQSLAPFDSFNLGAHVGDNLEHVEQNRKQLQIDWHLDSSPLWLNQTHSTKIIYGGKYDALPVGDACYSDQIGQTCAVMTADCIPLLATAKDGKRVMAIHAGWRGLAAGIVEKSLSLLGEGVFVAIGAHIGKAHFQVGENVRQQFIDKSLENDKFFTSDSHGKYLADLSGICKNIIVKQNAVIIPTNLGCTFEQQESYFSYRRDGETGRQVSMIWRS